MSHPTRAGRCLHCTRPIVDVPYVGWLHTDGRKSCLDAWRWDTTGTCAEPTPNPVPMREHIRIELLGAERES